MSTTPPIPVVPDKDQCAVCRKEGTLNKCKGCMVAYYCGRDHQKSHWPEHKKFCNNAKMCNERVWDGLESIKQGLQASPFTDFKEFCAAGPVEVEAYFHYR